MPFGRLLAIATGSSRLRVFCSNPLHARMPILVQTTHSSKRELPTLTLDSLPLRHHCPAASTRPAASRRLRA